MKKTITVTAVLGLMLLAFWRCGSPHNAVVHLRQAVLPIDVCPSCIMQKDSFNAWFATGAAGANGIVLPASSIGFLHRNNCDFYKWSEQMFLWLTSPLGSNSSVMESPEFFNVSPDSGGMRKLTPHTPGVALRMTNHIEQTGANRLPTVVDKAGRLREVENTAPGADDGAFVKNQAGNKVQVANIKADVKGTLQLFDAAGKQIIKPRAILHHNLQAGFVQRVRKGKNVVFLDASGPVQTESAQDTGDVLISQNGSIVYYLTMVNDVFAAYTTAVAKKQKQVDSTRFPTTAAELHNIVAYARDSMHMQLPDSNALAMEIKTSWVEASTLADTANYFMVNATIPTYDTTSHIKWVPSGEKTVKMAMVGIHIVGSAAGHPEMIWATFEHNTNTPNASYQYLTIKKDTAVLPQDTTGPWLFSSNGADAKPNISHMTVKDTAGKSTSNIFGNNGFPIGASNTQRTFAWGSQAHMVTNPQDLSSAASNSEIIAINLSVQNLLQGADRRKNYLFIGSTWTDNGAPPNRLSYSTTNTMPGVAVGASLLANSTMETYKQTPITSCFFCHSRHTNKADSLLRTVDPKFLSHVFNDLQTYISKVKAKNKPLAGTK